MGTAHGSEVQRRDATRTRDGGRCPLYILAIALLFSGCESYRVEHHTRPDFFNKASLAELPDEITLDDGTVVKYHSRQQQSTLGRKDSDKSKAFQIREDAEDGKVVLRALLPEHVLLNTLACVRNQEYELLYEQLLAQQTKQRYEERGLNGPEEFAAFFSANREDLASTLTRMCMGNAGVDTSVRNVGDGVIRCQLRPQIAQPFKFTTVDIVKEGAQLKLVTIR